MLPRNECAASKYFSLPIPFLMSMQARALHSPAAAAACNSDALATVAVIVVLRTGLRARRTAGVHWHAHVRRAARWSRKVRGDAEYGEFRLFRVNGLAMGK